MRRLFPLVLLLSACARNGTPDSLTAQDTRVHFHDRTVDLAPFLVGYPYEPVLPLWSSGALLVDHQGATKTLRRVDTDLGGPAPDPGMAAPLTDVDFDARNRWDLRHHPASDFLYWQGDASNDEKIDLWRMPATGGSPEQLTDEPYVYGYSFAPDESRIALLPRRGEGPYTSCLDLMALDGAGRVEVLCDSPEASLTWDSPSWAPDSRGVITRVNLEGKRSRGNLAWIPFDAPAMTLLLDPAPTRRRAGAVEDWLDDHTPLLVVDDGDAPRVLAHDLNTGEQRVVYRAEHDLQVVELLAPGGTPRLLVSEHTPLEDHLHLVDPTTGATLASTRLPGSLRWLGSDDVSRALVSLTSAATPMQTYRIDVTADALTTTPWLGLPERLEQQIVRCDVQAVSIPTHDTDPTTNQTRQLHAMLYTPKEAPPTAEQLVRVTAFYGGGNTFSVDTEIHCDAGIATLSPAVRGSHGFGPAFAALNDKDLGGDEIRDLFAVGDWLVEQGYSADRIGVYGGSHGGYATMRALTFPATPEDPRFDFAFGVARAGFSDIVTFWETCNIPDWVVLEAGDPETESAKLKDRSPLSHVDQLRSPLVLVHGENDSRVPVQESRQMAAACEARGKPCTYVEFPGMGHHIKGIVNRRLVYETIFGVLETVGE